MRLGRLVGVLAVLAVMVVFAADASAMYNPATGTFMQRDPGPGDPVRAGTSGPVAGEGLLQRDPVQQYADGMNLYQYLDSTPVMSTDPSGLWRFVEGMGSLTGQLGPGSKGPLTVDFNLVFDPNRKAFADHAKGTCCSEIRFVQIYFASANESSPGRGWGVIAGIVRDKWTLDAKPSPYYPYGNWGDPRGKSTSSMYDTPGPQGNRGLRVDDFSMRLETCAVCSKSCLGGDNKEGVGDVFACVPWGHSYSIEGAMWNRKISLWKRYVDKFYWPQNVIKVGNKEKVPQTLDDTYYFRGIAKAPQQPMKQFLNRLFP